MKDSTNSTNPEWVVELLLDPLNLPEGRDFVSKSIPMTYPQFLELSERYLPSSNSRPDFIERKLERVFKEPFCLID